jgi:hypothetical protein
MKTKTHAILAISACCGLMVAACGTPKTQVGKSGKTGAATGALAGLVFGGSVSDMVAGATVGGLAGAAVGSAKAKEQERQAQTAIAEEESRRRLAMEQEAMRRAELQVQYEQRIRAERQRLETAAASSTGAGENWLSDPEMLERAFGKDSVAGLYALRDCQHDKAIVAAAAAENSSVASHQLASVWLRAMVAVDLNRETSARAAYAQLVTIDPEVLSIEDARAATEEAMQAVRQDRSSLGIVCST